MRPHAKEPSPELRLGRRALEAVRGLTILEDWEWSDEDAKWYLHCRLTPELKPTEHVPASTDWYAQVSDAYPWGEIVFYPAKQNGLTATFQHQNYNAEGSDKYQRRTGRVCLDTPLRSFKRHLYDVEPFDAASRLRWHVERALGWLQLAARDELAVPGEPFELPQFLVHPDHPLTVAFSEGPNSTSRWDAAGELVGKVQFLIFKRSPELYLACEFQDLTGRPLVAVEWGDAAGRVRGNRAAGVWLRLPGLPILPPWQAPFDWGQLRSACLEQGVDIDDILRQLHGRGAVSGKEVLLLGFPIPEKVGGPPARYHWQPLRLPALVSRSKPVQGFRPSKERAWAFNRERLLRNDTAIAWLDSENWHADQLGSRGMMPGGVNSKKFSLIGAGAVGSPVAELLVRAGCHRLTVEDGQKVEAGNLVRHTLTLDDLDQPKGAALARRLNRLSPHARVESIGTPFPPTEGSERVLLRDSDVIVDCTGNDEVLHEMTKFPWGGVKFFCSVSLGLRARRIFLFTAVATTFPHETFREVIAPWLELELQESAAGPEFPREGIGCWHPVFPARSDDVWLLASAAVKALERLIAEGRSEPSLTVFEQHEAGGVFAGVRRVEVGDVNAGS